MGNSRRSSEKESIIRIFVLVSFIEPYDSVKCNGQIHSVYFTNNIINTQKIEFIIVATKYTKSNNKMLKAVRLINPVKQKGAFPLPSVTLIARNITSRKEQEDRVVPKPKPITHTICTQENIGENYGLGRFVKNTYLWTGAGIVGSTGIGLMGAMGAMDLYVDPISILVSGLVLSFGGLWGIGAGR